MAGQKILPLRHSLLPRQNCLVRFPASISRLTALQQLDCRQNKLEKAPQAKHCGRLFGQRGDLVAPVVLAICCPLERATGLWCWPYVAHWSVPLACGAGHTLPIRACHWPAVSVGAQANQVKSQSHCHLHLHLHLHRTTRRTTTRSTTTAKVTSDARFFPC